MEAKVALNLRTIRADWPDEPLEWGEPEPLTRADLQIIAEVPKGYAGEVQSPLQRLKERHHALARLLASGDVTDGQAGILTGYNQPTISILRNDPAFIELLDFYRNEVNVEFRSFQAKLARLGGDSIDELQRRVEDKPEELGAAFLLDIVTKVADRTGNGPTSSTTNKTEVNVTLDLSARMKQARESARLAIEGVARDVTPKVAAE
jgi:hypothetical protein